MHRVLAAVIAGCLALVATPSMAQVPQVLGYHGMLTDASGKPVPSTTKYKVTFSIFKSLTATGTAPWSEQQQVQPDPDGYFSVQLGSTTPFPVGLFGSGELYLELRVETQTLSPRQRIVSSPYSLLASAGGTLEVRGSVDMSSGYNNTKKVRVTLKARARTFKLRLVGEEFSRFFYTELAQHSHGLTGSIDSTSASCSTASSHTHKASGTTGTTAVTVNSAGNHSHSLSGTANNKGVSCSGANHKHSFTGGTNNNTVGSHRHRIRGYHGNAAPCNSWAKSCPSTGYYDSGHSLAIRSNPDKIPGMTTYGIAPVEAYSSYGYTDYHTSLEGITHSHSFSGSTYDKTVSVSCSNHNHSLSGSALSTGNHSHSTKTHGHTLSLSIASDGSHNHTCTHTHKHSLQAGSAGLSSGYPLASAAKTYPKDLLISIDGKDCTLELLAQASKNWGSTYFSLGDGTKTHPLVAGYKNVEGSGEMDLLKLNCVSKTALAAAGDHQVTITHGKSGGGKVRYEIVVEY